MTRFATFFLLLATFTLALAADLRTWSDASGKFTLQAKFIASKDGKVTLQRPDGSQFEIELAKLSPADQKYVAEQVKGEDNPFKPKDSAAPSAPAGDTAKTIDWAGVRLVDP